MKNRPSRISLPMRRRVVCTLIAATLLAAACSPPGNPGASDSAVSTAAVMPDTLVPFRVPDESEVTDSAVLRSVRRGRAIMLATRDSLPAHVGNKLRCVSCHMGEGIQKNAMPFVGVYARFPQYRARTGHIILIEDRINDCFLRSMNGTALPRTGQDMRDIVAYMAFLSRGVPVGAHVDGQGFPRVPPLEGDSARGHALFTSTCAVCHGPDGAGTVVAPPLWGPESFNIGAGMARLRTAASFIRNFMPQTAPGSLTDQQAYDLAAYVTSQPRPDYPAKIDDWPDGNPPPDVAYPIRSVRDRSP